MTVGDGHFHSASQDLTHAAEVLEQSGQEAFLVGAWRFWWADGMFFKNVGRVWKSMQLHISQKTCRHYQPTLCMYILYIICIYMYIICCIVWYVYICVR